MTDLNIVNQQQYTDNIQPKMLLLKEQLDLRSPIWAKVSCDKKKAWIKSDKDPLMTLAFQLGQYLKDNFPELLEDYDA